MNWMAIGQKGRRLPSGSGKNCRGSVKNVACFAGTSGNHLFGPKRSYWGLTFYVAFLFVGFLFPLRTQLYYRSRYSVRVPWVSFGLSDRPILCLGMRV